MPEVPPLIILAIGMATIVAMIVALRINAFFALITAALLVSLLAPGETADKVSRVATAFGNTAGSIGIVIAMAAVIGVCMLGSGAADRIVRWCLTLLGERRGAAALASSGFVLAIPVFFDTVFYLLVPLARSMYRRTHRNYVRYLVAIAAGAVATHALVPPTPGPLIIAKNLGIDLGTMIIVGAMIAFPSAVMGLLFAGWIDRRMTIAMRPISDAEEPDAIPDEQLPGLVVSLLPILLPVLLISLNTITQTLAKDGGSSWDQLADWTAVIGNPNLALLLAAAAALRVYIGQRTPTRERIAQLVEGALMSGGMIILITAGGGAFGAMLKAARIGPAIESLFASGQASGLALLFLGFSVAALLKFAQGSSTVAMITASAMLATMISGETLSIHPVYLATAIGSGSLVGSWMNDSGFWIFAKMGGLTEVETLKSWTPLLVVVGTTGMFMSVLLATVLPMG